MRQKKPSRLLPSISGGVLQLAGNGGQERAQDHDGDRQLERDLRQDHAVVRVDQVQVAQHEVERQDRRAGREEQAEREEGVQRLPAAELVAGEHEGRADAERHHAERRAEGDDRAVERLRPELALRQHPAVGAPDPRVGQPGRVGVDLGGGAEAAEDHVEHRRDRHGGDGERQRVGERAAPPASVGASMGRGRRRRGHAQFTLPVSARPRCHGGGRSAGTAAPRRTR